MQSDNKQWWKTVKSVLGLGKKNDTLLNLVNNRFEGNISKFADEIKNAFASVSKDLEPLKEVRLKQDHDPIPGKFIITPDEVEKQLSNIKISKAMGPDSIPNWILK